VRRCAHARVDTWAFGLGSASRSGGCALSQIGNVGPTRPGYIVDSFMVVVFGGVGQLAGTVYAALVLGFANKLLESWSGAVIAKIAVLVFIIFFIQRRPQGLFALKAGRSNHEARLPRSLRRRRVRRLPLLNLVVPRTPAVPLGVLVTLIGKIMCYAIAAVALDLVWATPASCRSATACSSRSAATPWHVPDAPDRPPRPVSGRPAGLHGVSRLEGAALALVDERPVPVGHAAGGAVPGLLAFVFGYFAFARE